MRKTKQMTAVLLAVLMTLSPIGDGVVVVHATNLETEMQEENGKVSEESGERDSQPGENGADAGDAGQPEEGDTDAGDAGQPEEGDTSAGDAGQSEENDTGAGDDEQPEESEADTGDDAQPEESEADTGDDVQPEESEADAEEVTISENSTQEALSENSLKNSYLSAQAGETTGSLAVTGDSAYYAYDEEADVLRVKPGAKLTITNASDYRAGNPCETGIVIEADAFVTLQDLTINMSDAEPGENQVPVVVPYTSASQVQLILSGENVLKAGDGCAAIQKAGTGDNAGKLTISGEGKLTAVGGTGGAGIGAGAGASTKGIAFCGGTIAAYGGAGAPGIGGMQQNGIAEDIVITGGSIKAVGGAADGENTCAAISSQPTDGAGKGVYKTYVDLTEIYGTQHLVTAVEGTSYSMQGVWTDEAGKIYIYLPETPGTNTKERTQIYFQQILFDGRIGSTRENTLTRADNGLKVIGNSDFYEWDNVSKVVNVKAGANLTFTNTEGYGESNPAPVQIYVESGSAFTRLTLDNVHLAPKGATRTQAVKIEVNSPGDVELILKGKNSLKGSGGAPSVEKSETNENVGKTGHVVISGDGGLNLTPQKSATTAIKVSSTLVINGGTISASAKRNGIRGGMVEIAGGRVTAKGGTSNGDVGIYGDTVAISGGIVQATGYNGIGVYGASAGVVITGGTVTAKSTSTRAGGSGIWSRASGEAPCEIEIAGGRVTADGGRRGNYAIGGSGAKAGDKIRISGGTVTLTGWIGGGSRAAEDVIISGGYVKTDSIPGGAVNGKGQKVCYARADLLTVYGRNKNVYDARIKMPGTVSYGFADTMTDSEGYIYLYLPVSEADARTEISFDGVIYEGILQEGGLNELMLKSSPDERGQYGDVLRGDIPADGIPQGIWMVMAEGDTFTYTGKGIMPGVRVYDYRTLLKEKTDYVISYRNNINVASANSGKKAPTITVKGTGSYSGSDTQAFTIRALTLKKRSSGQTDPVRVDDLYLTAPAGKNPKAVKVTPVVTCLGKKLTENKDYTLEHVTLNEKTPGNGNKNAYTAAGVYTVKIKGKGNYTGSREMKVTLAEKSADQVLMSQVTVAKIPAQSYDAAGVCPELTVTYGKGKAQVTLVREGSIGEDGNPVGTYDYSVTWENNRQVGTATAILRGSGGFDGNGKPTGRFVGEKRVTFQIKGTQLKAAKIALDGAEKPADYTYTGEAICPAVTVTLPAGKGQAAEVLQGGNYTVSYERNLHVGTATVTVTGMGGYTGTVKKTFRIRPLELTAENLTLCMPDGGTDLRTEYAPKGAKPAVQAKITLSENGQQRELLLKEGADYTVSYKDNKKLTTAETGKKPQIILKGKGDYKGAYSGTFTIVQKDLASEDMPVSMAVADIAVDGGAGQYRSLPVLTDTDGTKLKADRDFTVSYDLLNERGRVEKRLEKTDVVEAGRRIFMTVQGTGSYTGKRTAVFRTAAVDFSKVSVKVKPQKYTGKPVTLTEEDLTVTLKVKNGKKTETVTLDLVPGKAETKQSGYQIVSYQNNTKKGTAQVTIRGVGDYGGTKTVKFTIGTRRFLWWFR